NLLGFRLKIPFRIHAFRHLVVTARSVVRVALGISYRLSIAADLIETGGKLYALGARLRGCYIEQPLRLARPHADIDAAHRLSDARRWRLTAAATDAGPSPATRVAPGNARLIGAVFCFVFRHPAA